MSTPWELTGNSNTQPGTDFLGTTDASPLVIKTNQQERMRIGTDGSLSFPSPFTIQIDDAERLRIDQNNIVIRTPSLDFRGTDTTPPLTLKANGESRLTLATNGSLSYTMTEGTNPSVATIKIKDKADPLLEITTDGRLNFGPDRLTVTADGQTGIGTSTPLTRMHAVDSGGFGNEDASGVMLASHVPLLAQSDSTTIGALNADGRSAFALNIDHNQHSSNARGIPTFYDRYDGNWHHAISLKNGNVGVGTYHPSARLQVVNGAIMPAMGNHANAGIQFPVDPGGGVGDQAFIRYHVIGGETAQLLIGIENEPDDTLALWQSGAERLTIHGGKVGIGTSRPDLPLAVEAGARLHRVVVGASPAGLAYEWDYETVGVSHPSHNLRLQSPLSIIFHTGGNPPQYRGHIDPSGNMVVVGNMGVGGYQADEPGIHTWDVVAEGGMYVGPKNHNGNRPIRLYSSGYAVVDHLKARKKDFDIPHPLDPDNKRLIHGCIEGPEYAVFYRGESCLNRGKAVIELPEYFEALTRAERRTVQVTPICSSDESISLLAASSVRNGRFEVRAIDQNNPLQGFYWEVKAVRADVAHLQAEPEPTNADTLEADRMAGASL